MSQIVKSIFILPVKVYKKLISPMLPPSCRFQPTCSTYMIEAIQEWGVFKGIFLGVKRILHCHPWSEGGWDPVPKKSNRQ